MFNQLLKQKQEEQIRLGKEINDLRAKYDGKAGDLNGSEVERFETILNDYDKLGEEIASLQKNAEREAKFDQAMAKAVNEIPQAFSKEAPKAEFKNAIQVFGDALRAGMATDGAFDSQAFRAELNNFQVANPSKGGFSVLGQVLAQTVVTLVDDQTFIRQLATVEQVNGADSLGVVTFGDLDDFSWTTETATQAASSESPFGKRELQPKRLSKLVTISKKLMRNSATAENLLLNKSAYVFARTQEKGFISGTGVGQPLGFTVTSNDGITSARNASSGTANAISADDIWLVVGLLKSEYRRNAAWVMHRNTESRIRRLKAGSNEYLWQPVGTWNTAGLTTGIGPTLAGFPYFVSEFMPDPAASGSITTGAIPLVLADFRRGYMIADGMQLDVVPMIETYAASDMQGFAMNGYVDGMPVDPNAFARLAIS